MFISLDVFSDSLLIGASLNMYSRIVLLLMYFLKSLFFGYNFNFFSWIIRSLIFKFKGITFSIFYFIKFCFLVSSLIFSNIKDVILANSLLGLDSINSFIGFNFRLYSCNVTVVLLLIFIE